MRTQGGVRKPDSAHGRRGFLSPPSTTPGRWAVMLAVLFVLLFVINGAVFMSGLVVLPWREVVGPFYGFAMLLCGLASGILGAYALIRRHERSWMVWLTVLPGALVLFLVLGEFLGPPH